MHAVQLPAFGDPTLVPSFADTPDPAAPGAGEVLVDVLYAPVNHNDLLVMGGRFPYRPELPAVLGNEGVGRITALGSGINHLKVGDLVLPPLYSGTWRERMVLAAADLFALPVQADIQQLAMIRINPVTAGLMLSEYVDLQPGDWIVQNAANSGVGRAVIALARARGLRTINLVRREELVPELRLAGGDIVLVDQAGAAAEAGAVVGTGKVRLALDGVAGGATARLVDFLSPGASIVAYADMGGDKTAPGDLRQLMFKSIGSHFFYQNRPQYRARIPALLREIAGLVASGRLHVPVARTYRLPEFAEAIAHTLAGGKVLFDVFQTDQREKQ
jgi:NADPH:quinone reductase-like Zn-dependent oxidoreductase